VAQFKYLVTTLTNQNLIKEDIKRRLYSGTTCYHSVQNLLTSRLLSKKVKHLYTQDYKEERRRSVYENKLLGRIFGWKRDEVMVGWRKLLNEELHNFNSS
jgi:hypothetical protein